jgi:phosphatidylserine/phosphatidylglycerophosphate/cardiolipin synthase-like enzyme
MAPSNSPWPTAGSIAHNQVMVIDDATVITGSFNFTAAAQSRNAKNLLVFMDSELARQYTENWERRQAVSAPYTAAAEFPKAQQE